LSAVTRGGLIAFLIALALRCAWVLFRWQAGGAALEFDDERLHWEIATNLADRKVMVSDDGRYAARMPAYPLFLLPFAEAGDNGVLWARLAQCALGAAAAAVAFDWARRAAGTRGAWLAGLLVAIDPFGVFFCNLLLTETPFTLVAIAWSACVWRAVFHDGRMRLFAAVLGPLTVMLRPSAAAWLVAVVIGLAVFGWRRRKTVEGRDAATLAGLSVLATVAMFLPWGARNAAILGGPAWLSANGGWTLYDAQGPQADGGSAQEKFVDKLPALAGLGEMEQDEYLRRAAVEQMRSDPQRVLRLAGVKFVRTWNPIPNFEQYRRPAIAAVSAAYTIGVLIAAFGGLVFWRKAAGLLVLAWTPIVVFTLVHMIYVGSVRYRVPLMPFLAMSAAAVVAPERKRAAGEFAG
jgi:hypothetical protein